MNDNFSQHESILENDDPVYEDYFYLAGGQVIRSEVTGTVLDLKKHLGAKQIRRCDVLVRDLSLRT